LIPSLFADFSELLFLQNISLHALILQLPYSADKMPALSLSMAVLGIVVAIVLLSALLWWLSSDAICCCNSDVASSEDAERAAPAEAF
jgi:hypothetical protein